MLPPSRIALFAASALFLMGFAGSILFAGGHFDATSIALRGAEFIFMAALVWVGTYVGARIFAPRKRTARLAQVLALLYGITGVALAIPIKTHAGVIDMPKASTPGGYSVPLVASITAASIAVSLAIALISLIVVGVVGMTCGDRLGRDA